MKGLEPSLLQASPDTNPPARVEFLTFDSFVDLQTRNAIEASTVPSKELSTEFAIVMIGFVPVLTAVWVIFCFN
jgi:hypothetical protein